MIKLHVYVSQFSFWLFGLCYAMDGGYKGWNPYIERHLAIFVNYFCLERTNQLSLLPDKDLVDLCSPIEPYQVTKNPDNSHLITDNLPTDN